MPLVDAGGLRQYYRLDGVEGRPVLVLSHALGCDHTLWDEVASALLPHFRVLRYDTRGHGATEAKRGEATIERLGRDALALVDALGIRPFVFCGLSLGGMVGQWLAAHAPDRVVALILANTSARHPDPALMEDRRRVALEQGMAEVEAIAFGRFFSDAFLAKRLPAVAGIRRVLLATDPAGYASGCAAIRDMDLTPLLPAIRAPTLVLVGDLDVATPWNPHGAALAAGIAAARVERLPAGHLSAVERPRAFAAAVLHFSKPAEPDALAAGFGRRGAVLGAAHVDRVVAATTGFNAAFQDLLTRFAWGTVWSRPGLDDRPRRLLALTATGALGRWEEFRLHVRTGLAHELEPCDLEEALLQLAVYAGIPAANTGFQIAAEEMAKAREADSSGPPEIEQNSSPGRIDSSAFSDPGAGECR